MFVKGIKGELIREVFELGAGNSFKFGSEVQRRVEALVARCVAIETFWPFYILSLNQPKASKVPNVI